MTISIETKAFRTAYITAASVAPARSPKPILQSVKLIADPDGYSVILGTDLEVGVRVNVAGVRADRACEVVLPTKFGEILSRTQDAELVLDVTDDHIEVRGLRSKFKVATENAALYPSVPAFDAEKFDEVATDDLRRLISRTAFATDTDSTRYALGGVLYERSDNGVHLSFIGTDGRRLAKQTVELLTIDDPDPETNNHVIPAKTLKLISRVLSACDNDAPVQISINKTCVLVRTHHAVIWSRLVEGRFPRYQDVFPNKTPETTARITAGELRSACGLVSITTSDESRGCDFDFSASSETLKLSSNAPDAGSSAIEVPLSVAGKSNEITFDPSYLVEPLSVLPPETEVRIELLDAKHAAVMRTDDGYSYVVMPLTRDR